MIANVMSTYSIQGYGSCRWYDAFYNMIFEYEIENAKNKSLINI